MKKRALLMIILRTTYITIHDSRIKYCLVYTQIMTTVCGGRPQRKLDTTSIRFHFENNGKRLILVLVLMVVVVAVATSTTIWKQKEDMCGSSKNTSSMY